MFTLIRKRRGHIFFEFIDILNIHRGRRGGEHMIVGFITTCAISTYHQ
jgi:hypothetical protein